MDNHQQFWDAHYERKPGRKRTPVGEPWLDSWLHLVPGGGCRRALDVGCGSGQNARVLLEHGFQVTAIDFCQRALELCRRKAPKARVKRVDLREGLPFDGDQFDLIVADQSLHYFPWDMTAALIRGMANRLADGGVFAGRFNSTRDAKYGAGEPVHGEPNLLIVDGIPKRFFTRECFSKLFGPRWTKVALTEKSICRFDRRKIIWELMARRVPEAG